MDDHEWIQAVAEMMIGRFRYIVLVDRSGQNWVLRWLPGGYQRLK